MLSKVLKELRATREMSQAELAHHLNVAQQTVGKWEKDIAYPNIDTLLRLASYFNVSTDYLLGRTEYTDKDSNPPSGQPSAMELSPEEESLLRAYRNATDRDKSIVDAVLYPKVRDEKK